MSPQSKYWGDVSPCPIGIDAPVCDCTLYRSASRRRDIMLPCCQLILLITYMIMNATHASPVRSATELGDN